jgi:hypothetical protein
MAMVEAAAELAAGGQVFVSHQTGERAWMVRRFRQAGSADVEPFLYDRDGKSDRRT